MGHLETGPVQSLLHLLLQGSCVSLFTPPPSNLDGTSMHSEFGSQSSSRGDKYTRIDHNQPRQRRITATRYSSDSSTSKDSSASDDSYLLSRRRTHSSKSLVNHTRPKLPLFRCDKNWDSFFFQFQRQVNHYGCSTNIKGKVT